jgi:hypothetical protein
VKCLVGSEQCWVGFDLCTMHNLIFRLSENFPTGFNLSIVDKFTWTGPAALGFRVADEGKTPTCWRF